MPRLFLIVPLLLVVVRPASAQTTVPLEPVPQPRSDGGWALGAGIYGLCETPLVLALAAGSEATRKELVPSLPLGIVATR